MKYTEILKKNREIGATLDGQKYHIGVLSNIVVNQFKDVLELSLRESGIFAELTFGDYDNIVQDSASFNGYDAIIIFWEIGNLVEGLHYKFGSTSKEEFERLRSKTAAEIQLVFKNLEKVPLVIFNKFESAPCDNHLIHSSSLRIFSDDLNSYLNSFSNPSRIIFETSKVLINLGLEQAINERQFQQSKALYTVDFFRSYSSFISPVFLAARGKMKKALILDCDNTLWGGIIGEDGLKGISLDPADRKGKIFQEIHHLILGLKSQGIIIGLCSKNDLAEVDNVLDNHPSMGIGQSDIVIKKVNWKDKASNLKEIAKELNIGTDSLVFVDDSDFELGLIMQELPEVLCVQVPSNLSDYPRVIREAGTSFFNLSTSEEDSKKTERYQQESQRKELLTQHQSIESYLESLKLKVNVLAGANISVSRTSQLSQKTNQFNLTTLRYTESEIQAFSEDKNYEIVTFSVSDMYGDYGITGLMIIHYSGKNKSMAVIDTFLMSCRIIGRNIEFAIFNYILEKFRARAIKQIIGEYRPTPKNSQVKNFYDDLGFEVTDRNSERTKYLLDISNFKAKAVNYIEIN